MDPKFLLFIGKMYVENYDNAVGVPRDQVVTKQDLPDFNRVFKEGTPITRDYRGDRLNVELDKESNVIKRTFMG